MYTLFLDESTQRKQNIFGLGGILLKNDELPETEERFYSLKDSMGLSSEKPLKWNLSDQKPLHRTVREILESQGIDRFKCRTKVLNFISSLNCVVFACLLEESRWTISIEIGGKKLIGFRPKQPNLRDFYPWALKWILQRIYFFTINKDLGNERVCIVLDKPSLPKGIQETTLNDIYRDAYDNGFEFPSNTIPPLKECLRECLTFSYTDQSTNLQLADFCIGAIVNYGEAKIEEDNHGATELFNLIRGKFYCDHLTGQITGYGIVIHPRNGSLMQIF